MSNNDPAFGVFQISTSSGSGSAFGIAGETLLATNFHVVSGARQVAIVLTDKHRLRGDVRRAIRGPLRLLPSVVGQR